MQPADVRLLPDRANGLAEWLPVQLLPNRLADKGGPAVFWDPHVHLAEQLGGYREAHPMGFAIGTGEAGAAGRFIHDVKYTPLLASRDIKYGQLLKPRDGRYRPLLTSRDATYAPLLTSCDIKYSQLLASRDGR